MSRFRRFIFNGTLTTIVALLIRAVSVAFNVYVSNVIGAEGLGVFALISTAYGFSLTVATSGIHLATVKLVSEAIGECYYDEGGKKICNNTIIKRILGRCFAYAFFFSISVSILLFFGSDYIGNKILFDKRTVVSLKILSFSLLPISFSNVLNGYFIAIRRVHKNAVIQVISQFVRIIITMFLLGSAFDTERACMVLVIGIVASEIIGFLFQWILYSIEKTSKIDCKYKATKKSISKKLRSIALPVAFSAYLRSGLVSIEHILIPICLEKNSANKSASLASYGTVHSMVFPLVLFPAAISSSFASLLVPEISESNAANDKKRIKRISIRVLRTILIFSIGVAGIMCFFANELGSTLYPLSDAGRYIGMLAPLIPVMYIDTAVDSILKGLGQQVYTMWVNIIDSSLSVILVVFLLPRFGIWGYIMTVYFTELINAALSITRLLNIVRIKPQIFLWIIKPLIAIIGSTFVTKMLFKATPLLIDSASIRLTLWICVSVLLYLIILICFGVIKVEQVYKFIKYSKKQER